MRDGGQGWTLRGATIEWGLGAVFAIASSLTALAGGLKLPGAWALPILVSLGIVGTGRAQLSPLVQPLLLLIVATAPVLILHGPIDFLWLLVGPLLAIAVLAGERQGPWLAEWLGRLVALGVALRLGAIWLFRLPLPEGEAFGVALALCLLTGAFIADGRRVLPLATFLVAGVLLFDRLDWILVGCGVAASTAVGRRPWRGLSILLFCVLFAFRAPAHDALVIGQATDALLRQSPAILIACFWFGCAALALLRRSWKLEPKGIVLGSAGVIGLLGVSLWVTDRAADPQNLYLAAFCIALGLAARRREGEEAWELTQVKGPSAKKAAVVTAVAVSGAAIGAVSVLARTPQEVGVAGLVLLAILGAAYLFRDGWPGTLLAPALFVSLSFLVTRPFSMDLAPGSALWWKSTPAPTALFSLAAALAGAAHAIRRPGRIGAAQVAGAVACFWLLGLVLLDDLQIPIRGEELALNVSMGAFSVFMLFMGWAGPLDQGKAQLEGRAKRLTGLPTAAIAFALAATVIAGLS